jgi:RHS repeat-associated protein
MTVDQLATETICNIAQGRQMLKHTSETNPRGRQLPERKQVQQLTKRLMFFWPKILLAAIATLWMSASTAQTTPNTITVAPSVAGYFYGAYDIPGATEGYESTSLADTWAYAQASAATPPYPGYTVVVSGLQPISSLDGIQQVYEFDVTYTYGSYIATFPQHIVAQFVCPAGFAETYNSDGSVLWCTLTIPNVQPPPKNCRSCFGNPIYAATGQKVQVETDYSDAAGLNFTRTYRSNNGFFASVLTQAFADGSTTAGTLSTACYPASTGTGNGINCIPYMSTGSQRYQLVTDDGLSIGFSGPNNAVTANADINERVTQLTVSGATEWQVKRDDDTTELYNATGNLIQKTARGGRTFTYTYSTGSTPPTIAPTPGLLLTESDGFGHVLSWQYNASGQMIQMTDPSGALYQYSYDSSGNLSGVNYPDGASKTYSYNESANTSGTNLPTALTGITDENGVRYATFQYNSSGLAVNTQHAGGVNSYTFNYASPGINTSVTDPLGTSRTYSFQQSLSYDLDGSQTQPGGTQSETYDANGNPASVTDYNGNVTNSVYDLTRNLETSRTEAYGTAQARTISTQWNAAWRQPALITEPNRNTAFTYDSLGNVLTKTVTDTTVSSNVARTWTYTYDSYGRMLTATGPRTDVNSTTTNTYYSCSSGTQCGRVQTSTNALGQVTTFNTYNAYGQPLTITDPNGVVATLTYDARTRVSSRQVGAETIGFSYYPTGLVQTVTLPDSSTLTYTYDGAHRLTKVADGTGNYVSYTLDAMGNRTASSAYDPNNTLSRTHSWVFNNLNELYQDTSAAGATTTLGYDANGNSISSAAPLSRTTASQYDALNRMNQVTDPASGITQLGYDANDNVASVTDPLSLQTTYAYDGFGELTQQSSPATGATAKTYDSGGNMQTLTDARGAVAAYTYDALNRVTAASYQVGGTTDQSILYTYDAGSNGLGRLTGASDADHTLAWSYDALGRVTGKAQTVGWVTLSVGYGYSNGDLTAMRTPSGQTVTYTYADHQITGITVNSTSVLTTASYEPFGPVRGWAWGNGTTEVRLHNTDGNQSQVSGIESVAFSYDDAERITGIANSTNTALSWSDGYDSLDRLTGAAQSGTTLGWSYDADGNRLQQLGASAPSLLWAGASFTYNGRGRMSSATAQGSTVDYVYNAIGQMIDKSGASTTLLLYDEAGHLLGEYTGAGALIQETMWLGDLPVATLQPNGSGGVSIYYIHADQLNAPRTITRPTDNAILWRWDADPYGTSAANPNPQGQGTFSYNLRFPGQYYQVETGLMYNYFRDYDPSSGRYVESDPIGLEGGINTYAYAGGNPISNSDPLGLTYVTNWNYFWSWFFGAGSNVRTYGPNDVETQEMEQSVAAQQMRDAFQKAGCKNVKGLNYGTAQAYVDTTANPWTADWGSTAFEVGGFAGGSVVNNGDGTATYSFPNVSGTHSFFFHVVPDRQSSTGMMRNITQRFTWTEPTGSGCGCQ